MTENFLLDPSDIRVLRVPQRDASQSIAEIAKAAGMSQTPCWRRIKKLKEMGVIRQVVAVVDRESVGLGFVSYAFVKLDRTQPREHGDLRQAGASLAGGRDL